MESLNEFLRLIFQVFLGILVFMPFYKLGLAFRRPVTQEATAVSQAYRLAKLDNDVWQHLVFFGRIAKSFNDSGFPILVLLIVIILSVLFNVANFAQIMLLCSGFVPILVSIGILFWAHCFMSNMVGTEKKREEYAIKHLVVINSAVSVISCMSSLIFFCFIFLVFSAEVLLIYLALSVLIFLFTLLSYFDESVAG